MAETKTIIYPYRWVVLSVFSFLNITIQILWISFASITLPAARFYQCRRPPNRDAGHGLYDRFHTALPAGLMDD